MGWADFYLVCFLVGIFLSALAFLAGSAHLHLPHLHVHGPHVPHVPHAAHGPGDGVSPFNFGTIAAFLAWFGGTGYLLQRFSSLWFLPALAMAGVAGFAGGWVVFFFLARVLTSPEENLNPADYEMIGVLGTVSSRIRPGGTGEILFSQEGVRRAVAARSETGSSIDNGAEVVVTRYETGVAWVRPWEELAGDASATSSQEIQ